MRWPRVLAITVPVFLAAGFLWRLLAGGGEAHNPRPPPPPPDASGTVRVFVGAWPGAVVVAAPLKAEPELARRERAWLRSLGGEGKRDWIALYVFGRRKEPATAFTPADRLLLRLRGGKTATARPWALPAGLPPAVQVLLRARVPPGPVRLTRETFLQVLMEVDRECPWKAVEGITWRRGELRVPLRPVTVTRALWEEVRAGLTLPEGWTRTGV